jgi:hypothetical protein
MKEADEDYLHSRNNQQRIKSGLQKAVGVTSMASREASVIKSKLDYLSKEPESTVSLPINVKKVIPQ